MDSRFRGNDGGYAKVSIRGNDGALFSEGFLPSLNSYGVARRQGPGWCSNITEMTGSFTPTGRVSNPPLPSHSPVTHQYYDVEPLEVIEQAAAAGESQEGG